MQSGATKKSSKIIIGGATQIHPDIRITFLGTSSAVPDPGSDTASYVIQDRILVDTGWFIIDNLHKTNVDPLSISHLLFTHLHHDHYLSLPSLFFYWLMKNKSLSELTIAGPAADIERVVRLAMDFLKCERFFQTADMPVLIKLQPGDSFEVHEFRIRTHATIHPVDGVCYRFEHKETGDAFVLTGDTAYFPPLAEFAAGSKLLIHEASLGPVAADPDNNAALHSGAVDAANIAKAAGVDKLVLIHGPLTRSGACVDTAKSVFGENVVWPKDGTTITISGKDE